MINRKSLLTFEAVILTAPALILFATTIPMIFLAIAVLTNSSDPFKKIAEYIDIGIVGGLISLIVVINLAVKTIQEKIFSFNIIFLLGVAMSGYATQYLEQITNITTTTIVVTPLLILSIHFTLIQLSLRKQLKLRN